MAMMTNADLEARVRAVTRQSRTFYEAIDGLMVRKVEGDAYKHLATCGRGLWLDESRGAHCTARCRLIRAWLDANEQPTQARLVI